MNINDLLDRALFALSVPKCVCCGERLNYGQKAFCLKCYSEFEDFKDRSCSRCAKKLNQCSCSNDFLSSHFVKHVIKCSRYIQHNERHPLNSLIYSLKRDNRNDVLDFAADELILALSNSIENLSDCIFTNIPRRKAALIEFGIDHSALLAQRIAHKCNAQYLTLMRSNASAPQKSLDHEQRRKNADFSLISETNLSGKTVIIIDDIITSGASMSNAAMLLRGLGTKNIYAACLAIAYKDSKD